METTRTFAILASIPEIHLVSGLEAIAAQLSSDENLSEGLPKLALGSMAFEIFRKADEQRKERDVEVLIHAADSQEDQPINPEVRWRARYIRHLPSRNGRYPGKPHFQPQTTKATRPTWAVYWELQELEKLKISIPIGSLQGLGQKNNFKPRFIPEEPVLMEYPFAALLAISKQKPVR